MIIEARGDWFNVITWCEHAPSQPNETFKGEYHKLCFDMIKTTHDSFQWHIKHSQLFGTSHATSITTKHRIK